MLIFRTFEDTLSYLRANINRIQRQASAGDTKALALINAYGFYQRHADAPSQGITMGATEDYARAFTARQICRLCGEKLDVRWQTSLTSGHFQYTCWMSDCPMCGFTLTGEEYPTLALNGYLKGRVAFVWDYDAVIDRTRDLYPEGWQRQVYSLRKLRREGILRDDMDTDLAVAVIAAHKTANIAPPF